MSAEYLAERLMDLIDDHDGDMETVGIPDEDLRSGGWFFDVNCRGKSYEITVVETVRPTP